MAVKKEATALLYQYSPNTFFKARRPKRSSPTQDLYRFSGTCIMASVSMEYELPNIFNSYPINRKNTLSTMSQGFPCRYFIKPLREYLSLRGMEGLFTSETLTVSESSILEVSTLIASTLAIIILASSNHTYCGSVT